MAIPSYLAFGRFFRLMITPASATGFQPIPVTYSILMGTMRLNIRLSWYTNVPVAEVENDTL
jgi:hypothetical protein